MKRRKFVKNTFIGTTGLAAGASGLIAANCRGTGNMKSPYEIRSPGLSLQLSDQGEVTGIRMGPKKHYRPVTARTLIESCEPQKEAIMNSLEDVRLSTKKINGRSS